MTHSSLAAAGLLGAVLATMGIIGCGSEEEEIPLAQVKPVTAYGLTLDDTAGPKQVAFVLLRSIADDFQATQAHDKKRQKEALHLTYSLAAYTTIAGRIALDPVQKEDFSDKTRNKKMFVFVRDWTPIAAHYVRSFDTDAEAAGRRMAEVHGASPDIVHILYEVSHDPKETDPAKRQTATLDIELARERDGALSYWRVSKIAFVPPAPRHKAATRTAPASAPHG
jgi:hypothetical protein